MKKRKSLALAFAPLVLITAFEATSMRTFAVTLGCGYGVPPSPVPRLLRSPALRLPLPARWRQGIRWWSRWRRWRRWRIRGAGWWAWRWKRLLGVPGSAGRRNANLLDFRALSQFKIRRRSA